jgi:hypothetical protein
MEASGCDRIALLLAVMRVATHADYNRVYIRE